MFGYFKCEIESNNQYFGLLPLHINGNLILATAAREGKFTGVWFSEELKFARDHGYKIKVLSGYNFNKSFDVFKEFVETLYLTKSNSEGSIKAKTKNILNSTFGRFGMNIDKPITEIVDKKS